MRRTRLAALVAAAALVVPVGAVALADDGDHWTFQARLDGFQEVPPVFTSAFGEFRARTIHEGTRLEFQLTYAPLQAPVTAAHIHFGQPGVNGGVVAFLCGGGGKPACPQSGTVSGVVGPEHVALPVQGIAPGEFAELLSAMQHGVTYANVHSTAFPGGEIRGHIG